MKHDADLVFFRISIKAACILMLCPLICFGQGDIPVGSWRFHTSYSDVLQVSGSDRTLFARSQYGLFYFSLEQEKPTPLTKLDGLYGHDFQHLLFDPDTKTLLLVYGDGTLNLVRENRIIRLDQIRINPLIRDKTIHQVKLFQGKAWLAAAFGIVTVDVREGIIDAAYLNLGPNGDALPIWDVEVVEDKINALSEDGLIQGNLADNLNDFNFWKRTPLDFFARQFLYWDDQLYFLDNEGSIYTLSESERDWVIGTAGVDQMKLIQGHFYFSQGNILYQLLPNGDIVIMAEGEAPIRDYHLMDTTWVLASDGLTLKPSGQVKAPSGPGATLPDFIAARGNTLAIPLYAEEEGISGLDFFSRGSWTPISFQDRVHVATSQGETYFLGTDTGLYKMVQRDVSPVDMPAGLSGGIHALAVDPGGAIWVVTNQPFPKLWKQSSGGQWENWDLPQQVEKMVLDLEGRPWLLHSGGQGNNLRLFHPETGINRTFGTAANMGGLPHPQVRDMNMDATGNLWLGMSQGLGYFFNAGAIRQESQVNAISPLIEGSPILAGTAVNTIRIAPDRSIWVGTQGEGVWHFSSDAEQLLSHFTAVNSPLPSNEIRGLDIDVKSGEVFVSTSKGGLSYRSGAILPSRELGQIKIFPNPVRPDFNGFLSIEGLTDYSTLKVATSGGRVVASMQVAGGKVTWNLMGPGGRRLAPGVYWVYVLDEQGIERAAGKFLMM